MESAFIAGGLLVLGWADYYLYEQTGTPTLTTLGTGVVEEFWNGIKYFSKATGQGGPVRSAPGHAPGSFLGDVCDDFVKH